MLVKQLLQKCFILAVMGKNVNYGAVPELDTENEYRGNLEFVQRLDRAVNEYLQVVKKEEGRSAKKYVGNTRRLINKPGL